MTELAQRIAREYGTPAVVVDLDRVERNIRRLQARCEAAGVANRPHIKNHKSPVIAAMQRDAGAKGITCQKLGEAEVMAAAGFDDILISYNIMGEEKVARLAALMDKAEMTVCVDNPVSIEAAADAAGRAGRPLKVLVECDTGRKRAGVETAGEAVTLARAIGAILEALERCGGGHSRWRRESDARTSREDRLAGERDSAEQEGEDER